MKLGILVNTDRHLDVLLGLTEAALEKGDEVTIFCMDVGTRFYENETFTALCKRKGVRMGFCSHNAEGLGLVTEGLPEDVVVGSQYDNAVMNHDADKVIVL
jgi:predicted peroxiredoxin